MRELILLATSLAVATLAGCGRGVMAAPGPALAPIESVLLQAPHDEAGPVIQAEQQTRREQTARHGENSRTGQPKPQPHGLQGTL
jgi:hypothetical protein